jgi:hypothetical protein
MAGTSSAKTRFALLPGHDEKEAGSRAGRPLFSQNVARKKSRARKSPA